MVFRSHEGFPLRSANSTRLKTCSQSLVAAVQDTRAVPAVVWRAGRSMKHPAIDVPVVDHGKAFRRIRLGFRPGRLAIMAKVPRRLVRHRPDSYPGFSRLVLKLGQLAVGLVLLEVPGKPGFHQLMGHILSLRDNPCD